MASRIAAWFCAVCGLALAGSAAGAGCGGPEFSSSGDQRGSSSGGSSASEAGSGAKDPGPGPGPGSGQGGGGGGGAPCDSPDDACSACITAACPGIACACWTNPECPALFECYPDICNGDPPPPDCIPYCMSLYASAVTVSLLTANCAATNCLAECPWSADAELDMCQKCAYVECDEAMTACLIDADCYAYIGCVEACADTTCVELCGNNTPPVALDLATVAGECVGRKCPGCG